MKDPLSPQQLVLEGPVLAGAPLCCSGGSGQGCFSFSSVLAASLAGGGDFLGEVLVLGFGACDPD